jgi:hypothetical protein
MAVCRRGAPCTQGRRPPRVAPMRPGHRCSRRTACVSRLPGREGIGHPTESDQREHGREQAKLRPWQAPESHCKSACSAHRRRLSGDSLGLQGWLRQGGPLFAPLYALRDRSAARASQWIEACYSAIPNCSCFRALTHLLQTTSLAPVAPTPQFGSDASLDIRLAGKNQPFSVPRGRICAASLAAVPR